MTGIVLCGGNSTRMGSDKGLLKEEEETWAEIAARKLKSLHLPVFVSVNSQQFQTYEQIFSRDALIVDSKSFNTKAPLIGLLSAHLQLPDEDLFVLACDIRDMTTALLAGLMNAYITGIHEAYVYQTAKKLQPLCGIYTAAGLKKIYQSFRDGVLMRNSMMHVLELLHTNYLAVRADDLYFFSNYNSPEEL